MLTASMIFFGCSDDDNNPGGSAGSGGTAGSCGMAQAREVAATPVIGTLSPYARHGAERRWKRSVSASDLANTPEFEPGLEAYDLRASGVDAGGVASCPP